MKFGVVFLILMAGVFLGCSPAQESSSKSPEGFRAPFLGEDFKINSCAHQFTEGGEVLATLSGTWDFAAFGKPYDKKHFEQLLDASAKSVYLSAQSNDVQVYQVPSNAANCAMYGSLPTLSASVAQIWKKIGEEGLLAVFLPLYRVQNLGEKSSVILIRADADRYTLMHEYLHHLFNQAREKQGQNTAITISQLGSIAQKLKDDGELNDNVLNAPQSLQNYTVDWLNYNKALIPFYLNFAFEEVAVEKIMRSYDESGKLKFVTDYDRKISSWYIHQNYLKAANDFLNQIEISDKLETALEKNNFSDLIEQNKQLRFQMQQLINEGGRIDNQYATPRSEPLPPIKKNKD